MFVSSTNYQKVVTSIAAEEGELLLAVAFLGARSRINCPPPNHGSREANLQPEKRCNKSRHY